jgi:SSS family solute:Na+ symporter
MGFTAVIYTVFGGLKAVIYTDTVQWIILMGGLIFIGIPMSYFAVGGYDAIVATVPASFLSLGAIEPVQIINWAITIIPIWFIGMTLYQRIYACRDEKTAKKAWFIAGLLEWPIMAFMGVLLGLFAKVALDQGLFSDLAIDTTVGNFDPEMGLPILLRSILPVGLMGLMMSAYFSAIMSTADSCLMAASGNLLSDIISKRFHIPQERLLRYSHLTTLFIGILALALASQMTEVLGLMLVSYSFMVSGLFVPLIVALFFKNRNSLAAWWSILIGGSTTLILELFKNQELLELPLGLDANLFGISASLISYLLIAKYTKA